MFAKAFARRMVSARVIGRPSAAIMSCLGADRARARILDLCGYMPDVVEIAVPRAIQRGARFMLYSANQTDQIAWRLWSEGWRGFEPPLPDLFAASSRQAHAVLDVGANSGLYAMIAIAASAKTEVHAFEPLPAAIRCLRDNARLNNCNGRLHIVEAAVADKSGMAELFVPAGNESLLEMSASLNSTFRKRHAAVLPVQVFSIDDYVMQHQISRIDVMKIDVESQEHRVLAGAAHVLDSHRPVVFLEVLPGSSVQALEAIRHQFDYSAIRLRECELFRTNHIHVDHEETNQVLCPREKLPEFCAMAKSIGYRSVDEGEVVVEPKDNRRAAMTEPASLV
jgi:FkbM family methyltransferase